MLTTLRIQNVVLIEALTIEFRAGLCALTGETGAGKSILLDSLGLATGARADSGLVRKGADQAQVTAVFDITPNHPALNMLKDSNLEAEETLILRRTLTADGRSKAFINDQPVSAGLLREIGESLLEVHGQFDTHGIMDPKTHRQMLDDYAGIGDEIVMLWDHWKAAENKLEQLRDAASASQEQEAYLRTSLEDLDALEPKPDEEEMLSSLRESLMHREQVLEALNTAYHALSGEHDPVRTAWSTLDRIAGKLGERGAPAIDALGRASAEIQEAVSQIQSVSADLEDSEHDLESIDNRLHDLRTQARKHACSVDDLASKREELAAQLNAIEHADEALEAAAKIAETQKAAYLDKAQEISDKRKHAAAKLDKLVQAELIPLKLEKARFFTGLNPKTESTYSKYGIDDVQFLVSTNPGADPGPLNKIASGGEMSRFMLALKVVLAQTGSAGSLVFDEVDAGIGGSTANAVGERLAGLSRSKQVLVVTHSPQVAARAANHYIVQKSGDATLTTSVIPLQDSAARREEIARMLAGAEITQEARAAADKLLESKAA